LLPIGFIVNTDLASFNYFTLSMTSLLRKCLC